MLRGSGSIAYLSDVMKKKETLNFRVSAEFKRKLIEEAKKERRSLTNYLETALTKLWEQQESGDTPTVQGPRGCNRAPRSAGVHLALAQVGEETDRLRTPSEKRKPKRT